MANVIFTPGSQPDGIGIVKQYIDAFLKENNLNDWRLMFICEGPPDSHSFIKFAHLFKCDFWAKIQADKWEQVFDIAKTVATKHKCKQ